MNLFARLLVTLTSLPRRLTNRVVNELASVAFGQRVVIDWWDARILGAENIEFLGSFQAGKGLWLETIGPNGRIEIGHGARLSDQVHIGAVGLVHAGRNLLIGSKVLIIDHSHGEGYQVSPAELGTAPGDRPLATKGDIVIGDNVWLADNVVVLGGVRIGDNCVVGANSLVRTDLPAGAICAGNPARVLFRHQWVADAETEK